MKNSGSASVALLVVFLIALTGVSVYFWQSYEKEKALNQVRNEILTEVSDEDAPMFVEEETSEPETVAEEENSPVIVYTPSGLFTDSERLEIQTKFLNPFIDWNKESNLTTVSINIEKPPAPVAGYRYEVNYINDNGGNGGFLYGMSTPLEWWLPECMGGCGFSDEFATKYPEIVALVE